MNDEEPVDRSDGCTGDEDGNKTDELIQDVDCEEEPDQLFGDTSHYVRKSKRVRRKPDRLCHSKTVNSLLLTDEGEPESYKK